MGRGWTPVGHSIFQRTFGWALRPWCGQPWCSRFSWSFSSRRVRVHHATPELFDLSIKFRTLLSRPPAAATGAIPATFWMHLTSWGQENPYSLLRSSTRTQQCSAALPATHP